MLPVDQVEIPESISNPLNSVLMYCKLVDELKTYAVRVIGEIVLSLSVIRCLKLLLARILTASIDSEFSS